MRNIVLKDHLAGFTIFAVVSLMTGCVGRSHMKVAEFNLGTNIVATAKATGIPKFEVDNVNGAIEYSAASLPVELPLAFSRPGYNVTVKPAFALSLNADRRRTPDDIVFLASVQVETDGLKSHQSAKEFVNTLLGQFQRGRWSRYIASACPAVSGRSSLFNIAGELDSEGCSLDPTYEIPLADWRKIFRTRQPFEWLGDAVVAKLTVGYDEDDRGINYTIFLDFEDHKTMAAIDAENELHARKEGDAKGWNTSANAEEALKSTAMKIKVLEANALKRGDRVIPR
jgi:hypothetical protein